jgi:hypothetical protein
VDKAARIVVNIVIGGVRPIIGTGRAMGIVNGVG